MTDTAKIDFTVCYQTLNVFCRGQHEHSKSFGIRSIAQILRKLWSIENFIDSVRSRPILQGIGFFENSTNFNVLYLRALEELDKKKQHFRTFHEQVFPPPCWKVKMDSSRKSYNRLKTATKSEIRARCRFGPNLTESAKISIDRNFLNIRDIQIIFEDLRSSRCPLQKRMMVR